MKALSTTGATLALAVAAAVLLGLGGCASKPEVRHDQAPGIDLRAYKTFAFHETTPAAYETLLEGRLRGAAREQMERQGYVYSEADPELRLNLMLRVVERQTLQTRPGAFGYRGLGSTLETQELREGMLAVDVVDARRRTLVWRGVIGGPVNDAALQDSGKAIGEAMAALFAQWPGTVAP
jgi:Domain of unknown function (DUF4136)